MISYKYKLYRNKHNRELAFMLEEARFVWNHCLAVQKRYYSLYGKYVGGNRMKSHFAKRYKMKTLHSQTVQEVIERLDFAYQRFFDHKSKRPPKFKRKGGMTSFVFKQGGFRLNGNTFRINKLNRTFKFSLSRPYSGNVKTLSVKKSPLGEYYICVVTDSEPKRYGKTHDGASVGIDFGLKTYMALSDGQKIDNPRFLNKNLSSLRRASKRLSSAKKGSNNYRRRKEELDRNYEKVVNSRKDFQWKLAHELCRSYDDIFVEELDLTGMCIRWGRKMSDLAHASFVSILEQAALKYGCRVYHIDRYYPSSKTCGCCGYKNEDLKLSDRKWTCPECGTIHDRDLNAANNILRRGIDELVSRRKTTDRKVLGCCV